MRILVLAPHPFYLDRGTPLAVDLLVKALTERGDQVDLLTFHEGQDRHHAGMTIHRIRPWLPLSGLRPGFSLKKLVCDMHLFLRFLRLFFRNRYDVVHAVEESVFMAMLVCPWRSTDYIYDMDSSMADQLVERYPPLKVVSPLLRALESLPLRFATAVIPVCDALAEKALRYRKGSVTVLKDVSLLETSSASPDRLPLIPTQHWVGDIAMYIGNLEAYQGIDLMLESFALLVADGRDASLVIIGGTDPDVRRYRAKAENLGIGKHVHFLGAQPVEHLGFYLQQADVLLSPRTKGVNTPMKIYSYMDSGKPILATDLPTHTQVLSGDNAMLAASRPDAFASALGELFDKHDLRDRLASRAREDVRREHSYARFKEKLYALYERFDSTATKARRYRPAA